MHKPFVLLYSRFQTEAHSIQKIVNIVKRLGNEQNISVFLNSRKVVDSSPIFLARRSTIFIQRPLPHKDEALENFHIRVANKIGCENMHRFIIATKGYRQDIDHELFQTFPTDIKLINPLLF